MEPITALKIIVSPFAIWAIYHFLWHYVCRFIYMKWLFWRVEKIIKKVAKSKTDTVEKEKDLDIAKSVNEFRKSIKFLENE